MNKKWMKLIALSLVAIVSLGMLTACQSGSTYADEPGDVDFIDRVTEDAEDIIEVPYTGEPAPGDVIQTEDIQYYEGNLSGGDDNNTSGGDDENTSGGDDENNSGGDNENTSGGEDEGSGDENEYAALVDDKSGTALRLMSQNIRTGHSLTGTGDGEDNQIGLRRYRFKVLVEQYNPDVICTQEVTPLWIQQFEELLPQYDMVYKMRSNSSKEATPVHWKKDRFELVKYEHFWLSSTPDVESSCYGEKEKNGIPGRISTEVTLKDKSTGVQFTVISTHWGLGGGAVVRGCGNQLADRIAKLPQGSYGFVLGDYNDSYRSNDYYTYMDMVRWVDLRDIATEMADYDLCEMGDMNGTFSGFNVENKNGSGIFIDHVLAKPNKKMAVDFYGVLYDAPSDPAHNVGSGFVSDHFAVLCDVRINTSKTYDFYGSVG